MGVRIYALSYTLLLNSTYSSSKGCKFCEGMPSGLPSLVLSPNKFGHLPCLAPPHDAFRYLPRLPLWNLPKRLCILDNDIHPNLGPTNSHVPRMTFLTLKVGGSLLSMRRWGHLLSEIAELRTRAIHNSLTAFLFPTWITPRSMDSINGGSLYPHILLRQQPRHSVTCACLHCLIRGQTPSATRHGPRHQSLRVRPTTLLHGEYTHTLLKLNGRPLIRSCKAYLAWT